MSNAPVLAGQEKIAVLDYGSKYNQLFTRTIREFGVYSELHAHTTTIEEIKKMNPVGIVLSGGAASVGDEKAYAIDPAIFELGIPVLGISYGAQVIVDHLGGKVEKNTGGESKEETLTVDTTSTLFAGQTDKQNVWVNHSADIAELPEGFTASAKDSTGNIAAISNDEQQIYAIQFHPEDYRSKMGMNSS